MAIFSDTPTNFSEYRKNIHSLDEIDQSFITKNPYMIIDE